MPLICLSAFPVHMCLPLPRFNHGHLSSACLTLSVSASTLSDSLTRPQIRFHAQICPIFFLAGSLKFLTTPCHFSPHRPKEWKKRQISEGEGLTYGGARFFPNVPLLNWPVPGNLPSVPPTRSLLLLGSLLHVA